ncbi:antibiotic biosynthesis monooxygenase [bacterium]|nr:antibiotic biosynthesis monooxygenase [bacterium]MDG1893179.1 antibiotic biosynthesis monooxygenase [Verrucomicrobiota bacterium]
MYIAMNRFQIAPGFESAFEEMWRNRKSYLDEVSGFMEFRLLRGDATTTHTPFISHSVWASRQHFVDWTDSEAFTKAHKQAKSPEGMHLAHPKFEGFEVIL